MKKAEVIEHFGGVQETADALGIRYQSVAEWSEDLPRGRQFEIQVITNGALQVDPELLPKHNTAA